MLGCDVQLIATGSRFASGLPWVIIYIVQLNLKILLTSSSNEAPGTFFKAPARLYPGNKDCSPSLQEEALRPTPPKAKDAAH